MVSTNSSPPVAMPMHVPQGHMVQQVLDENGTLQHVILSPDPMSVLAGPQGLAGPGMPPGASSSPAGQGSVGQGSMGNGSAVSGPAGSNASPNSASGVHAYA